MNVDLIICLCVKVVGHNLAFSSYIRSHDIVFTTLAVIIINC